MAFCIASEKESSKFTLPYKKSYFLRFYTNVLPKHLLSLQGRSQDPRRSSPSKVFLRYSENMRQIHRTTPPMLSAISIKKSHFGLSVLLYIYYMFSEHLFIKTPIEYSFCTLNVELYNNRLWFLALFKPLKLSRIFANITEKKILMKFSIFLLLTQGMITIQMEK